MSASVTDPRRGRWIPWVFVGAFLVVVSVNAVLIWASVSTFTGVTIGRAYERGRGYDEVLAEAARQDSLGWRTELRLEGAVLRVTAHDRDGQPLPGRMEGVLRRPLEGVDLPLEFRATATGAWSAETAAAQRGQWEARLTLWGPGAEPLDIRQRLLVP